MTILGYKLQKAINFAAKAHGRQMRKSTKVPYIVHPMSVAMILQGHGFDENLVIAGVLHDVLEDTNVTYLQLKKEFGEMVANYVKAVSEEDKEVEWGERKRNAIAKIKEASRYVVALKAADAISNMEDMYTTYQKQGDSMFEQFGKGKPDQLARYSVLTHAILEKSEEYECFGRLNDNQKGIFEELKTTLEALLKIF